MITLRAYQEAAVNGVRKEYAQDKKRVILVMPTGAGKTVVFSYITKVTASNGKNILVLAHRKELLTQCGDKLMQNGVEFGYLNPAFTPAPQYRTQVGTMQTVVKRMTIISRFDEGGNKIGWWPDLIIVDECHRSLSNTYRAILNYYAGVRVLGVTATPIRGDGQPLGDFYEGMVLGPTIKELIAMGALVPPRTFGPEKYLDLTNVSLVKQEDGSYDYNKKQVAAIVDKPGITDDAVLRYKEKCPGVPAVAFCVSVEHAKHVAADFCAAGYKFEVVYGNMPDRDTYDAEGNLVRGRDDVLKDLKNRRIHGIASVDLVTEGFDAPLLQAAIMLRPTQSEGLYLQMAGRVLRSDVGKSVAYILDHAGCSLMHGVVTINREWSLEAPVKIKRKNGDKAKSVRTMQCPECFIIHEPAPKCPECNHEYVIEVELPTQKRGQLVEITEEAETLFAAIKGRPTTAAEIRKAISEAKTFDDLRIMERYFGYKRGWAKNVWAARNKKNKIV